MKSCARSWWLACLLAPLLAACGGEAAVEDVSIAAVRASALGTKVRVTGFVTVPSGRFNSATEELGFSLQDASGGIYVTTRLATDLPLGTPVRLEAELHVMNTQPVLAPLGPVEKLVGSLLVEPRDIGTGSVDEATAGRLVRVRGRLTQPVQSDLPYGYLAFVSDGSGVAKIFVHLAAGNPVIDVASLNTGDDLQVTGFVFKYNNVLEIAPRQPSDLVKH